MTKAQEKAQPKKPAPIEFPHTLTLSRAYEIAEKSVEVLVFREPVAGDFFGLEVDGNLTFSDLFEIAANLTGQPLPLFRRLNLSDGRAVAQVGARAWNLLGEEVPGGGGTS